MKPLALRTSLTLAYTGMLALLATALAVGYHRILATQLDAQSTAVLEDITRGLHGYLKFTDGRPSLDYNADDPEAVAFVEEATRYYQVYDATTGRLLTQSSALELLGLQYTPSEVMAFRGNSPHVQDMQTDRGRLRLQSSVITPSRNEAYLLQVGEPLDRLDRALAGFERLLAWQIGAGLLASALLGQWMAGRALGPLAGLVRGARAVSIDNLQYRVPVRGAGDELDEVAIAFNQALERVEDAVGEMRQFSTALAHELRTPLAVLRGETELALREASLPDDVRARLAGQIDELDKLTRLINQILTLARAESGQIVLAREPVDLTALAASVAEQLEPVAEAQGLTLTSVGSGSIVVRGDAGWLERLLLILLDNAIKFTPGGGRIVLSVASHARNATLSVADTGAGIEAQSLPSIFKRFYRADQSRSRQTEGAGLGLALARWIVDHHHGTIEVTSRPKQGSTFAVHLPLEPAGELTPASPEAERDA